ncbi:PqiC family protein [Rhodanobacter sp. FW106-PBR-LB-2-11]|uniref:PqiC family protein n=1 Tax=Rhodanobacter sp. FW106-PBR-LB-2-11 TaxID=1524463 RepID=UPI0034E57D1E
MATAAMLLAACASAPTHYYTLVAPADAAAASPSPSPSSPPFELLPVGVPAQVDQPQLVVREGGQSVALLGSERWIAPLGDEVRSALSADLARELRSADVSGLPGNDRPLLRIKLDLRRFDSAPGSYALVEAAWSVRLLHGAQPAMLACTSRVSEAVGPGYPALVQGHQRAIGQLAAQIADAARRWAAAGGRLPARLKSSRLGARPALG